MFVSLSLSLSIYLSLSFYRCVHFVLSSLLSSLRFSAVFSFLFACPRVPQTCFPIVSWLHSFMFPLETSKAYYESGLEHCPTSPSKIYIQPNITL